MQMFPLTTGHVLININRETEANDLENTCPQF